MYGTYEQVGTVLFLTVALSYVCLFAYGEAVVLCDKIRSKHGKKTE